MFGISEANWDIISKVGTVLGILGVSLGGIWIIIWATVRKVVNNKFEAEVTSIITKSIKELMPELAEKIVKDAQNNMMILSQVLSLHLMSQFDEILNVVNWDGNIEKLRGYNKKVRLCIIDSLYNCDNDRDRNRDFAWSALEDMFNEGSRDIETITMILEMGLSSKRYSETKDKIASLIDKENNSIILSLTSTLYRKLNDPINAEQYARKAHGIKPSIGTALALAVLFRDQGKFDNANDLLKAEVMNLRDKISKSTKLPDGWQRIFNTYIANCLDMEEVYDCMSDAEILSRYIQSPVETATLGRYLIKLKKNMPSGFDNLYKNIYENFSGALRSMHECEAKCRCIALKKQLDGDIVNAITTIDEYLAMAGKIKEIERGYLECYKAAMYIDLGENEKAKEILINVRDHSLVNGEAEFILAKCYVKMNNPSDAVIWLKKAISRQNRWLSKARKSETLKSEVKITEMLANYTTT